MIDSVRYCAFKISIHDLSESESVLSLDFLTGDLNKVNAELSRDNVLALIFPFHFEYLVDILNIVTFPFRGASVTRCVNDSQIF